MSLQAKNIEYKTLYLLKLNFGKLKPTAIFADTLFHESGSYTVNYCNVEL